jgi:acyl homoserine lactone synthase
MIRIMKYSNNNAYIKKFYALRTQAFSERRKWDVQVHEGLYEYDQYDNSNAYYLLCINPLTNNVFGGIRLIPTNYPYMLKDIFAKHLNINTGKLPMNKAVWEISRFVINVFEAPQNDRIDKRLWMPIFFISILKHALAFNLTSMVTVSESKVVRLIERYQWPFKSIGKQTLIGSSETIAGYLDIKFKIMQDIRSKIALSDELLKSIVGEF